MYSNFCIMTRTEEDGNVLVGLHEVYYDDNGYVAGWSAPIISADDPHALNDRVKDMCIDADWCVGREYPSADDSPETTIPTKYWKEG